MHMSDDYQPRHELRRKRLPVRGIDYAINEWGDPDAPVVFYLHGFADTGSCFQFVADELASDWFIVAPDWRGFGRTVSRAPAYWFPDYVADLHAVLDSYSPFAPVRLVGHSMGGNIGALYAGSIPERVASFINLEGFGLPDSNPEQAPDRYREWIDQGCEATAWSTYRSLDELAQRIAKLHPNVGIGRARFVAAEWACTDNDSVTLRADPNHRRPNAILYRRAEAEACWRRITARTLLVAGGKSRFAAQFGDPASLPFPGADSVTIDGSGHMLHFEQPRALAKEIRRFLANDL